MHLALGSVTEGLLTQIAPHTFRDYVSALGSLVRAGGGHRAPRRPSVAESSEGTSRTPSDARIARESEAFAGFCGRVIAMGLDEGLLESYPAASNT
jgi:hypothetical protein